MKKNPITKRPSIRELIIAMETKFIDRFDRVEKRLGTVEKRLETIEQLPTIQKELKTQKKPKSFKQKQ